MKAVNIKTKKTAKVRVVGSQGKVLLKLPRQNVGSIALVLQLPKVDFSSGKPRTTYVDGKLIRQWELEINGDELKTRRVV